MKYSIFMYEYDFVQAVIFMVEERSQLTLRTDQSREIRQLGSWGPRVGDFYG
jgi:hypothetical protein